MPERRTKRCSPRFRPGDRFWELSFRYLSPDSEGEKCRPLDHIWQIPFIHSGRLIIGGNFYIYVKFLQLFSPCGTSSIPWHRAYLIIAGALLQKHSLIFKVQRHHWSLVKFRTVWCILAQGMSHLRMLICWTNEMVVYRKRPIKAKVNNLDNNNVGNNETFQCSQRYQSSREIKINNSSQISCCFSFSWYEAQMLQ